MSVTTTIKCDRCHKEVKNTEIKSININVADGANNRYEPSYSYPVKHADWCIDCCVEMQVYSPKKKTDEPTPPPITIEDLVREIVREETS